LDLAQRSEYFTVTANAAQQIPTKIGVIEGQEFRLEELLEAILLTSANDAAQVIADGIDAKYEQEIFIRAMNKKARILGMEKTHFQNAQGFDAPNHFSSAEDVAVLMQYALTNYPLIAEIVEKDYSFLEKDTNHNQYDLYNWNGLIGVYPGAYGVKIGNTEAAQKTTAVAAKREGKNILVVLLGAPGLLERDGWSAELLNTGFAKFGIKPYEVTEDALQEKYATWKTW
jgi:D-alanyl-D-alanine carboxypeptidase